MVVESTDLERQAIYLKLDNAKNSYSKYEKKIFLVLQ